MQGLQVRRLDLVAAEDLLDEEQAVGGDRNFGGRPVDGPREREQQRAVLRHVVRLVAERLEVLLGGLVALGRDVNARAGRPRVTARGAVDERAEAHRAHDSYELAGS